MLFMYFDGNCNNALAFYHNVFGAAVVEKTTYGEAEMTDNTLSIWLEFDDEKSLHEVYARFQQDDCNIESTLEETFWNSVYAKVKDSFGIIWELNYQR